MKQKSKKSKTSSKKFTGFLFFIYLIVLSWVILCKMEFDLEVLNNMNLRNINFIPLAESTTVNGKLDISEILLNIVVFIPFGLYMSILFEKWGFLKKAVSVLILSLLYEVLQYVFAIGTSDVTDLLGNTVGGIIGIGVCCILRKIFHENTIKVVNILATVGTVAVVPFLGLLVAANL